MEVKIKPLQRCHLRDTFDCGIEQLNNFLQKYSFQNHKNNISKTFVAINSQHKNIIGFYTLSSGQINFNSLPENIKHPKYPVSIARLARLVVDLKSQSQGIGGFLLYDALKKVKTVSETVGVFAVVVNAKDTKAKSFYQKYGFFSLQDTELTLCLLIKVLDKL